MKDRRGGEGMAAALDAVMALNPATDFLMTGGDLIDSLRDMNLSEATEMADLFIKTWNDHTDLPAYHLLGNHGAVGWRNDEFPKDHPHYAYGLMKEKLAMPALSHSFDHGGWHFVALHNITLVEPKSYVSEFDDDLIAFLHDDRAANGGKPTLLFGHFPPVTATEFFDGRASFDGGSWQLSGQRMSRNPIALVEAVEGANVKAFLSGHIHRWDRIETMGHTFINSGSVSVDKWRGHDHGTPEGFAVVDCHPDGPFGYTYHDYGWEA